MKEIFIGTSDFEKFQQNDSYYVDKSLFIREMIDLRSKVLLIPRPRRFGKTLNISMLQYYFERSEASRQGLFTDLAIWQQGEKYTKLQGTMPVIFVSFKDAKGETWEKTYPRIQNVLMDEYIRHAPVLEGKLNRPEQKRFEEVCEGTATEEGFGNSLKNLSQWLQRAYGTQRVLLLIDEYDTPIHQAYAHGYYNACIDFMRALLGSALKDNKSLERAVLTGILRVAKESIFSGLNNVRVCSILSPAFERSFGLLDAEVEATLRDFGRVDEMGEFRRWYNGYVFGTETVYNPWSIFHALSESRRPLQPYWVNTSDQQALYALFDATQPHILSDVASLLQGKSIKKALDEDVSFIDLTAIGTDTEAHVFWNFVLFSGYLKIVSTEGTTQVFGNLAIPNEEVAIVFARLVHRWIARGKTSSLYTRHPMYRDLLEGNDEGFQKQFVTYVWETFSYHDVPNEEMAKILPEYGYHLFVLGLLAGLRETYEVKSNIESGEGRSDVTVIPRNMQPNSRGFIFECKRVEQKEQLDRGVAQALAQIKEKQYDAVVKQRGVPHIVHIGIAFVGKHARVGMVYV
jgi:hypothetical protein